MRLLLKITAAALTAILSLSPNIFPPNARSERLTITVQQQLSSVPINNGGLMLYLPNAPGIPNDDVDPVPPPDTAPGTLPLLSRNIPDFNEDLSVFSSKDGYTVKKTFTAGKGGDFIQLPGGGQVRNATEIPASALKSEIGEPLTFKIEKGSEPQVLIIHTHTSESFIPANADYYDLNYSFHTVDASKNITAAGTKIAEEIAKAGFAVIHDGTIHDSPVYTGAYTRSAETVKGILKEYPSVKIILDIHRDAIEFDGVPVAAVAQVKDPKGDARPTAQVMIISPADDGNWNVPNYMENFRFAAKLQSRLESDNPGLTRPVLFEYCNYNLNLAPGALLIEIGSHGNTLPQVLNASVLIGKSIGKLLNEQTRRSD
jgi:stage II sporulation protein P